jgi:hypothetical protein
METSYTYPNRVNLALGDSALHFILIFSTSLVFANHYGLELSAILNHPGFSKAFLILCIALPLFYFFIPEKYLYKWPLLQSWYMKIATKVVAIPIYCWFQFM